MPPTVFISYNHSDSRWKDDLVRQLGVLEREGLIEAWHDGRIPPGADWLPSIEAAMAEARVAVFIVSAHFLNSEFVRRKEIPALMDRRRKEGLRIIPLIARPCPWQKVPWLAAIQARPHNAKTLAELGGARAQRVLSDLAEEIHESVELSRSPSPGDRQGSTLAAGPVLPGPAPLGTDEQQEGSAPLPKAPADLPSVPAGRGIEIHGGPGARMVFNGLDGVLGSYLMAPINDNEIGRALFGLPANQREVPEKGPFRGPIAGVDPQTTDALDRGLVPIPQAPNRGLIARVHAQRLDEAGWGLVMAEGADERFAAAHGGRSRRESLGGLCKLREQEAGGLYTDKLVLRQGESAAQFLARHGVRLEDPVGPDPGKVPYYLLLVGDPEEIPYSVQYELDLQYAVGRICFDRPEDYAAYADAVVAAQEGRLRRRRRVTFFAVENPGDIPTARAADELIRPLAASLSETRRWQARTLSGTQASRAQLAALLREEAEAPALLFTSSHGVGFAKDDPSQEELQGALVCQDWPGPHAAPLRREHYFGAPDLGDDARVGGLVAFLFAAYGVGTPRFDSFEQSNFGPVEIAPKPLVSRLPQRLLSHPEGAALAVVGHVDRAWTLSFSDGVIRTPQIGIFKNLVHELLAGARLGAAMEPFGRRAGALGARMAGLLEGALSDEGGLEELGAVWRSRNDARSFVVFGDPAVQLAVSRGSLARPRRSPAHP